MGNLDSLIAELDSFLEDFNYKKTSSDSIYKQSNHFVDKLIILNQANQNDNSFMLEVQLAYQIPLVESWFYKFMKKSLAKDQISLTYYIRLAQLDDKLPSKYFINQNTDVKEVTTSLEGSFTKIGFYWLDEYATLDGCDKLFNETFSQANFANRNIYFIVIRALIVKKLLNITITDDIFYRYKELLEENWVPQVQLDYFIELRAFLNDVPEIIN